MKNTPQVIHLTTFQGPLLLKSCTKCNTAFPLENFHYAQTGNYKRRGDCKYCQAKTRKQYTSSSSAGAKERYSKNKEQVRIRNAEYRRLNKEKLNHYCREWSQNNKQKRREYYQKHKERIQQKHNNRRRTDIQFKLGCRLRDRVSKVLKNKQKVGSAVRDLGCSVLVLKQHLESKFQPGMSWDNYGLWHIDHIRPLASFDLEDRNQFLQACHYSNLQPLWAKDNLSKKDKIMESAT